MGRLLRVMLSMNVLLFFMMSVSVWANYTGPLTVGKSYDYTYDQPTDTNHTLVVSDSGYYRLTIENLCNDVKNSNQAFMKVEVNEGDFFNSCELSDGKEYLDIYIEKIAQIEVYSGRKYRLTLTKKVIQDESDGWKYQEKDVSFDESITLDTGLLADERIKFEWSVEIDNLCFEKIKDAKGPSYTVPAGSYQKTENVYKCKANFDDEVFEYTYRVYVDSLTLDNEQLIEDDPENEGERKFVVSYGDTITLDAKAHSSYGKVRYRWYRNNKLTRNEERISGEKSSSLTFTATDGCTKEYICRISDGFSEKKVAFKLRYKELPRLKAATYNKKMKIGEDFTLKVRSSEKEGKSDLAGYHFSWYKAEIDLNDSLGDNHYTEPVLLKGEDGPVFKGRLSDRKIRYICLAKKDGFEKVITFDLTATDVSDYGGLMSCKGYDFEDFYRFHFLVGDSPTLTFKPDHPESLKSCKWYRIISEGQVNERYEPVSGAAFTSYTFTATPEDEGAYIVFIEDAYGFASFYFRIHVSEYDHRIKPGESVRVPYVSDETGYFSMYFIGINAKLAAFYDENGKKIEPVNDTYFWLGKGTTYQAEVVYDGSNLSQGDAPHIYRGDLYFYGKDGLFNDSGLGIYSSFPVKIKDLTKKEREQAVSLKLNQSKEIVISPSKRKIYRICADASVNYLFKSFAEKNLEGYLFDEDGNLLDFGIDRWVYQYVDVLGHMKEYEDWNFAFSYKLTKGKTYYLAVKNRAKKHVSKGQICVMNEDMLSEAGKTFSEKIKTTRKGLTISWKENPMIDGYRLYMGKAEEDDPVKLVADLPAGTNSYTVELSNGEQKTFKLVGYLCGEETGSEEILSAKYLASPKILDVRNENQGITVKWKKNNVADGYYIYRKEGKGSYELIKTVKKSKKVSFTDKNVEEGMHYRYKICAYRIEKDGRVCISGKSKSVLMYRVMAGALSSLRKSGANMLKVHYEKNDQADGYEIRYASKSDFSSYVTVMADEADLTAMSVSLPKEKKDCYVMVRAYIKKDGKKYHSAWSCAEYFSVK